MKFIIRLGLLFAIIAGSSACRTFPDKPDNFDEKGKVSVVSLMGEEVHITQDSSLIFAVSSSFFQAAKWNVNQEIEDLFSTGLEKRGYKVVSSINTEKKKKLTLRMLEGRFQFDGKFYDFIESPEASRILNPEENHEKVDYIIFIVPGITSIPNSYTAVKRYGYYSDDYWNIYGYVVGRYVLYDVENKKVIGSKFARQVSELVIKRNLYKEEKVALLDYILGDESDKDKVNYYRSLIFDGNITEDDQEKILAQYHDDHFLDESYEEEMFEIKQKFNPLHHTPNSYRKIPESEIRRLDEALYQVQKDFVMSLLEGFE